MPRATPAEPDPPLEAFRALVREASGIDLPAHRLDDLRDAVARLAEREAEGSATELLRRARPGSPLARELAAAVTIGESHFFRHRAQFDALERDIIPALIERRAGVRTLRFWSAGCSTGQEAYSLAILARRLLPPGWELRIDATDLDPAAIEAAAAPSYSRWSFREVSATDLEPDVIPSGKRFTVAPHVRSVVRFAAASLLDPLVPTGPFDVIVCRNVLMYLDAAARRAVLERFRRVLVADGALLLAPAETAIGAPVFRSRSVGDAVVFENASPEPPRVESAEIAPSPASAPLPPVIEAPRAATASRPERAEPATAPPSEPVADPLAEAEAAVAARPLDALAHYRLGVLLEERDRLDEAVAAYRRATYADPSLAAAHASLSSALARTGSLRRARLALAHALRLLEAMEPDAPVPGAEPATAARLMRALSDQG